MYDYIEGMCPVSGYRGLYPLIYEIAANGKYEKQRMDCNDANSSCKKTCPLFEETEMFLPERCEWKLRDKKIDEK